MADDGDEAARAFEELRGEVSLMRRAVERLAVERADIPAPPDYSETLGVLSQAITTTAERVEVLARSPALAITPDRYIRHIAAAGAEAREEDHRAFASAKRDLAEVADALDRYLRRDAAAAMQTYWLQVVGLLGLMIGIFVGPLAFNMVTGLAPASWHWPERYAAFTIGEPMWDAGARLMQSADPHIFGRMAAADRLVSTNSDGLSACRKRLDRSRREVRCTIRMKAAE